jgi:prepilin-type N-terminal cleavage/methylation domain-containing protein
MKDEISRTSRRKTKSARQGFTLLELLVVVAIIGLLMALLMPALRGARDRAWSVACRGNLRQWGVGTLLLARDNQGQFPSGGDDPGGPWYLQIARLIGGPSETGAYTRRPPPASTPVPPSG